MYAARLILTTLTFLCVSSRILLGQEVPSVTLPQNPSVGANLTQFFTAKTPYEFWLACLIALLGLAIIFALMLSLRRVENARAEDIARPVIVVTVIIGTLILVTVGYSNEQIAPAFVLFVTIVGYMLGRLSGPPTNIQRDGQQSTVNDPPDATKSAVS